LCNPAGTYLFHDNPRISVRRRFAGKGAGRTPFRVTPKDHLRVLMVVSRPQDAGFLDPRAEAQAVLAAVEQVAGVSVEFLRPATLNNLVQRLEDERLPAIDIVHFDGHGAFDPDGRLQERAKAHNEHLKAGSVTNTGYLLFEDEQGQSALVMAETLGNVLFRQRIGAIVLSACQSAAVAGEDALGSVAARLVYGGIPSVLAMQYSVLAVTAQRLFATFYEQVMRGKGLGEALDNARRDLDRNRARGERQRGATRFTMHLQDWFLPALYQSGTDTPLLLPLLGDESGVRGSKDSRSNLPNPQATEAGLPAGFWGRKQELWEIERDFVSGTRRLTIAGFGGQGKTALAQEVGRWLQRTGMFEAVCFVSYASYQSSDPLGYAVAVLGTVLAESFQTADEVTAALQQRRTLVILDNLESLERSTLFLKEDARGSLLNAALHWSEAGQSRVLLTTRPHDLNHVAYPTKNSRQHIVRNLQGLLLQDAVDYCQRLFALPPAPQCSLPHREGLEELLNMVDRHPLSIRLLTEQLKTRRPLELRQALADLLAQEDSDDPNCSLKASLNLSLQWLDPDLQDCLPRLGVFQGGAMENVLLTVMALSDTDEDLEVALARELFIANQQNDTKAMHRIVGLMMNLEKLRNDLELPAEIEQAPTQDYREIKNKLEAILAEIPKKDLTKGITSVTWQQIRYELESSGLIQTEYLSGNDSPYIKFHPTLAPVLWERLAANIRKAVTARHREIYYILSQELNSEDRKNASFARNLALRELPNLLLAVRNAIKNPSADTPKFVNTVDHFLTIFGMRKDRDDLTVQTTTLTGAVGSQSWYLIRSNKARQLIDAGCTNEAIPLFEEILKELGEEPSHERSVTLGNLGRCYRFLGQLGRSETFCQEGLTVAEILIETDPENRRNHQQQKEALLGDLANILMDDGRYGEARKVCEAAQAINLEFENDSSAAVNNLRLGTLALREGNLTESIKRYLASIKAFEKLNEPQQTAGGYYQLGYAYAETHNWEEAEKAYRTSAEIKASQGMIFGDNGAAATWNQLGLVCRSQGKLDSAEDWFRKALEVFQQSNDPVRVSVILSNLASLLLEQPHRLAEARLFAERSLSVKRNLDPSAAEIWKTYQILAELATQQGQIEASRAYLRQMRLSYNAFPGVRHELQQFDVLILSVVAVIQNPDLRQQLEDGFVLMQEAGFSRQNLIIAIRQLLNGERDEDTLCNALNRVESAIICATLCNLGVSSSMSSINPL
jgi:tetratricopeptide (TPR) repeat protein